MKLQLLRDAAAFRDLALHCIGRLNTFSWSIHGRAVPLGVCVWGGGGFPNRTKTLCGLLSGFCVVFFLNIAGKKMVFKKCGSGSIVLGRME